MKLHNPARRFAVVFLVTTALVLAACGSGKAAASSIASSTTAASGLPDVTLKYSCPCLSAPPRSPQSQSLYNIASYVKKASDGHLKIEVFENSSLVPEATEFESVEKDAAQMSDGSGDEYQAQFPAGMIYEIPFLFTHYSQEVKLFDSKYGKELNKKILAATGVRILGIQDLGARELDLSVTRRIETPADLHGIKLRMPPGTYWTKLGQALGGDVTPVGFNEIYTALETGLVQAQDNPLPTDISDKFYKVTKQIVLTNHVIEPVTPDINNSAWMKLSPKEQAILQAAVTKADNLASKAVQDDQAKDIAFLKAHGLKVYSPNIAAFRAPALKAFLCDASYVDPIRKEVPGMLSYALSLSGAKMPSCSSSS